MTADFLESKKVINSTYRIIDELNGGYYKPRGHEILMAHKRKAIGAIQEIYYIEGKKLLTYRVIFDRYRLERVYKDFDKRKIFSEFDGVEFDVLNFRTGTIYFECSLLYPLKNRFNANGYIIYNTMDICYSYSLENI